MKPKAPSTVAPSTELEYIVSMLKAASEYNLESEVVSALCNIVRDDPHMCLEQATFWALAEWDL